VESGKSMFKNVGRRLKIGLKERENLRKEIRVSGQNSQSLDSNEMEEKMLHYAAKTAKNDNKVFSGTISKSTIARTAKRLQIIVGK
jgi:hypothetical protein